jgi:outer membrane protein
MKLKIILFAAILVSSISIAQSKVGTVDSEYIVNIMPEKEIVIKRAQKYGARLDSTFSIKVKEYENKVASYKDIITTLSDADKKEKIQEVANMERDLKKFKSNGSKLMQLKQDELMRPLYKKLGDVIAEVSKANGFTQILTTTGNQFAYIDESLDITELVITKLGITLPDTTDKK